MKKGFFSLVAMLLLMAAQGCGSGDPTDSNEVDGDGDGFTADQDCDDSDAAVFPGATEACDGIDNNCDGITDEDFTTSSYYQDTDGDGYGSADTATTGCSAPIGYVEEGGDCDENNAAVNPGAAEFACNGEDENCNGSGDDHPDADADGYDRCDVGVSEADANPADCNDSNPAQNPGAVELCNTVDDNCNGEVDENMSTTTYYQDLDGDGYGNDEVSTETCSMPSGYASVGGDCDDNNAQVFPDAIENPADGVDGDCDGFVDAIFKYGGTGSAGHSGDEGDVKDAEFNFPAGISPDLEGVLYVADRENHRIRRIDLDGTITTVAGNGEAGYDPDVYLAEEAMLNGPTAVSVGVNGNVFVADTGNHMIRKISPDGFITIAAGTGEPGDFGDGGNAADAQLEAPMGVAADVFGNLYIADTGNNRIRKINAGDDKIYGFAGTGDADYYGDAGSATLSALNAPQGLGTDASGTVFIADTGNHCIRKIATISGLISTVAGRCESPGFYGDGGAATSAKLESPVAIYPGPNNLFVADTGNHRIRIVTQEGRDEYIRTIAGTGDPEGGFTDGDSAISAALDSPWGLTLDPDNNLLIANSGTHTLDMIVW